MKEKNRNLSLFITMLKIGAFTFGGGYAMIALLENEFVEKRNWLDREEFLDLAAIAESTPGPIAINAATYIGYKVSGFIGSLLATIAMCIPSFTIIYLISLFFDEFISLKWVACAFKGIQVCVVYLIMTAGIRMFRKMKKTALNVAIIFSVIAVMVSFSLFAVDFSTIFYILISGFIGVAFYCCRQLRKGDKSDDLS